MKRILSMTALLAVLFPLFSVIERAQSRGVAATERPWAPEHVEGLPPDIPQGRRGACEGLRQPAGSGHYFSVSIEASALRFWSLHFEDFACERRATVCRPQGCLHEVFADDGRHQQQVFSVYARDLKLTNEGGIAGIEVMDDTVIRLFAWNGRRFVAKTQSRKER